jgi:hypothetical protein
MIEMKSIIMISFKMKRCKCSSNIYSKAAISTLDMAKSWGAAYDQYRGYIRNSDLFAMGISVSPTHG